MSRKLPPTTRPSKMIDRIFAYYAEKPSRRSNGLGISTLGEKCDRRLWYDFRWASPQERFFGRVRKLFQTGHREEAAMIADLRAAGATVYSREEVPDGKGGTKERQIRVESFGGHISGYLDGVIELPGSDETDVLEVKTHNAKNFEKLAEKGVEKSHPKHFVQVQMGIGLARLMGHAISNGFYLGKNKDDDDLIEERIDFEPKKFDQYLARGTAIVFAQDPPPRASESFEYPPCRYPNGGACPHLAVCQFAKSLPVMPEMNCRTCLHSTPEEDGTWTCAKHQKALDKQQQAAGCRNHLFIPTLFEFGKPVDAGDDFVLYPGKRINREGGVVDLVEPEKPGPGVKPQQRVRPAADFTTQADLFQRKGVNGPS